MEGVEATKEWAIGMKPEEFAVEFQKRNPYAAGIVPDLTKWLGRKTKEFEGVTPFNGELIEGESHVNKTKPKKAENKEFEGFSTECNGCGQEYIKDTETKAATALRSHQRFCKELLK